MRSAASLTNALLEYERGEWERGRRRPSGGQQPVSDDDHTLRGWPPLLIPLLLLSPPHHPNLTAGPLRWALALLCAGHLLPARSDGDHRRRLVPGGACACTAVHACLCLGFCTLRSVPFAELRGAAVFAVNGPRLLSLPAPCALSLRGNEMRAARALFVRPLLLPALTAAAAVCTAAPPPLFLFSNSPGWFPKSPRRHREHRSQLRSDHPHVRGRGPDCA